MMGSKATGNNHGYNDDANKRKIKPHSCLSAVGHSQLCKSSWYSMAVVSCQSKKKRHDAYNTSRAG